MPKKLFKRWIPSPATLHEKRGLRFLGALLREPNLFHLNRHSVSVAFFVGVFVAFLPIPGHIPIVALAALVMRCNLPISITLIWISNPITFPFIILAAYKIGIVILQMPVEPMNMEISWEWFKSHLFHIWEPVIVGALFMSLLFSGSSYLIVQWTWRCHVSKLWRKRKQDRMKAKAL